MKQPKEIMKRVKKDLIYEKITPLLIDEIFHITSYENYKKILKSGDIKNNFDGKSKTTFEVSKESYFLKRKCVSLFDGRKFKRNKRNNLKEGLDKFQRTRNNYFIILFLSKNSYDKITSPHRRKIDKGGEKIIPIIEVGYKNRIPIDKISKVLIVTLIDKKFENKNGKFSLDELNREATKIIEEENKN